MFKEDKKTGLLTPGDYAKSALRELILYVFMAIAAVVTIVIAIEMRSWWPFAGWFVAVFAFGLLLERFNR
ncbi:hypothetical protein [Variovorax sp. PCZ-1]|uniref:hypothetical protein n=1 Tax=Variovorax sp. PCZ-1 TaxID=2835533 RepID=UPI001BCC9E49|nr:hypothetical protein [Variovorax sp. PCZ-1]MBS7806019.1 hypothetical protein [Variovorax sp. PCZ-1]